MSKIKWLPVFSLITLLLFLLFDDDDDDDDVYSLFSISLVNLEDADVSRFLIISLFCFICGRVNNRQSWSSSMDQCV